MRISKLVLFSVLVLMLSGIMCIYPTGVSFTAVEASPMTVPEIESTQMYQAAASPITPDNEAEATPASDPDEEVEQPEYCPTTEGSYFEVTNSTYLNVTITSSEQVRMQLESAPSMVSLFIEPVNEATVTTLTMTGFEPGSTYYRHQEGRLVEDFVADESGGYCYTQEIDREHHVYFLEMTSTIYIRADGTIEGTTSIARDGDVYTLTSDVEDFIVIERGNMTLDGNGFTLQGPDTGSGVYVNRMNNVTIQNLVVRNFTTGIYYLLSSESVVEDCTFVYNLYQSMYFAHGDSNMITRNRIMNNERGIAVRHSQGGSYGYTICDNEIFNNKRSGISAHGLTDSWITNNTIIGDTTSNNPPRLSYGISTNYVQDVEITDNNLTTLEYGIVDASQGIGAYSVGNIISSNTIQYNAYGIRIYASNNTLVTKNNVTKCVIYGILVQPNFALINGEPWGIPQKDVSVVNNYVEECKTGIYLVSSCTSEISSEDTVISENRVINSTWIGISIGGSAGSQWGVNETIRNYITKNEIYDSWQYGVHLRMTSNIEITENLIENTTSGAGIFIADWNSNTTVSRNTIRNSKSFAVSVYATTSVNATISWNDFYGNNLEGTSYTYNVWGYTQAYDDGVDNVFTYNFWDDWTTPDAVAPFGIVDAPYAIDGSASNEDPFPRTFVIDSDYDGIPDFKEIFTYGTDPCDMDSDDDELDDYDEIFVYGTNPLFWDTDGDYMPDKWELENGYDPLDPNDPDFVPVLITPLDGAVLDNGRTDCQDPIIWDFDWSDIVGATQYHIYVYVEGLTYHFISDENVIDSSYHYESIDYIPIDCTFFWRVRAFANGQWNDWSPEWQFSLEPVNSDPFIDTDGDGISDWIEINIYGTYPDLADSDGDGLDDPTEWDFWTAGYYSYWHKATSPHQDFDNDGFPNILDPDSDNDGLLDSEEYGPAHPDALDPDTDDDDIPDVWEVFYHNVNIPDAINPRNPDDAAYDIDFDGLTNLQEYLAGTDPWEDDSDSDGMPDGWELSIGLDPLVDDANNDPDFDTYTNYEEYLLGTDPWIADTDDDGLNDWDEINIYDTDPLTPHSDEDTLDDYEEVFLGEDGYITNPNNPDTDGDSLGDDDEVNVYGTDPTNPDTDGDFMPDDWEVRYSLDPTVNDNDLDPDQDQLINLYEFHYGTRPLDSDSDGDDLTDGEEVYIYGTDPCNSDTDGDHIGDGAEETYWRSRYTMSWYKWSNWDQDYDNDGKINLLDPDSDNDGLLDGEEKGYWRYVPEGPNSWSIHWYSTYTDPLDADTDDDELSDGAEVNTHGTEPLLDDTDEDGLKDGAEINLYGTDPLDSDSDGDEISDFDEVLYWSSGYHSKWGKSTSWGQDYDNDGLINLLDPDSDNDELKDGEEVNTHYTDPLDSDTDDDELTDEEEVNTYGTIPFDPDSDNDELEDGEEVWYWEVVYPSVWHKTSSWDQDYANDGLINLLDPDSDNDGFKDGEEVNTYTTDPLDRDTDDDELSDWEEMYYWVYLHPQRWNPWYLYGWDVDSDNDGYINIIDPDSDNDGLLDGPEWDEDQSDPLLYDTDGDFLNDYEEIMIYGTFAFHYDSDGDGFWDGFEFEYWEDEYQNVWHKASSWDQDYDNDGLVNLLDPDSDNDGITDRKEARGYHGYYTDPLNVDTDEDDISDYDEIFIYETDPTKGIHTLTEEGDNVVVTNPETSVTVEFDTITETGITTIESTSYGPAIPENFKINNLYYIHIETTADYSGTITISIPYVHQGGDLPTFYHWKYNFWMRKWTWNPLPTTYDANRHLLICKTNSLSIFATMWRPDVGVTYHNITNYYLDGDTTYVTSDSVIAIEENTTIPYFHQKFYRINGGEWIEYLDNFTLSGTDGPYTIEYYGIDFHASAENPKSVTVQLVSLDIKSRFDNCPDDSFIVILHERNEGGFELVATNPGTFIWLIDITNNWPVVLDTYTAHLDIPEDFCFSGTIPVHVALDGIDITSSCIIDGADIEVDAFPPGSVITIEVHLKYSLRGEVYASPEEFAMKSYTFGISSEASAGNPLVLGEGLADSYSTSQSLTASQKKMTAIAGYVLDAAGNAIPGVTVELHDPSGFLVGTTITDELGFYYFLDVDVSEFEVRVIYNDQTYAQIVVTVKWELVMVTFVV